MTHVESAANMSVPLEGKPHDPRVGALEAQLKAATNLPEASAMLGDIYARRREWRQAIASYQAALSKQPQLGQARLGLGIAGVLDTPNFGQALLGEANLLNHVSRASFGCAW